MKKITLLFSFLFGSISAALAQSSAVSRESIQPVQLTLADAIELTFPDGNPTLSSSLSSVQDLSMGVELPPTNIKVRSNRTFKVDVATSTAAFVYSGNALAVPVLDATSAIKIMVVNNNTGGTPAANGWMTLNTVCTAPKNLINNCDRGGNQTFSVKYKMTPGLNMPSGSYTIEMVFTATQM